MNRLAAIALPPLVLGLAAAGLSYLAAGHSLGFYFGGVAMIALLVPPFSVMHDRPLDALIAAGSAIDGIGIAWIVAAMTTSVTAWQWLAAYLVITAFGATLFSIGMMLRRAVGPTVAAAVTTIVALLWLAWPIWLSPWLTGGAVAWLAPAHPLLAINRTFFEMGAWTEQRLMYQITALGQDAPYRLPGSVAACVLVHAVIALALGWPAWSSRPAESAAPRSEASPAS